MEQGSLGKDGEELESNLHLHVGLRKRRMMMTDDVDRYVMMTTDKEGVQFNLRLHLRLAFWRSGWRSGWVRRKRRRWS